MSGYADTRDTILYPYNDSASLEEALAGEAALDALLDKLVEQADRIAWFEGDAAGWRIKLAECEERQR